MLSDSLSITSNSTVISSLSIPSTSGRCFLKFIVYEINSKIMVLTRREEINMAVGERKLAVV
jgi:hypothetical protein